MREQYRTTRRERFTPRVMARIGGEAFALNGLSRSDRGATMHERTVDEFAR
ncbi:hypothetical protein HSBGL_2149 [Halapricum desulfuricans]|uniref:Uncharacterized protein n=1 Tax=Halapricum desulfuricans TaxID=2841257 RepID=A0A897NQT0_9EURY|nr:hypothetical protein HSBGL_2149 [Halapricum desulfuricans]